LTLLESRTFETARASSSVKEGQGEKDPFSIVILFFKKKLDAGT